MNDKNVVIIDNNRYLIIEKVEYNNGVYAYLINSNDEKDTMFVELNKDSVKNIPRDLFVTEIFPLFADNFSTED